MKYIDVLLALNPIAETGKEVLALAAQMSQELWEKGNPEADKIECFLPNINTPVSYDPSRDVYWVANRLTESEAENLFTAWEVMPKPHALVNDILNMEATEVDGEMIRPEPPTWTVEYETEEGMVTVTKTPGIIGR